MGNTYSVPSRLIGATLLMRVRAEHLEGYMGAKQVLTLPRSVFLAGSKMMDSANVIAIWGWPKVVDFQHPSQKWVNLITSWSTIARSNVLGFGLYPLQIPLASCRNQRGNNLRLIVPTNEIEQIA